MNICPITVEQLQARCIVDPATHCWLWQGGTTKGRPRIYTMDYGRIEKRAMTGSLAAWHIAHQAPPLKGRLVYRCCGSKLCVNPAHMREANGHADLNTILGRSGRLKGLHSDLRLQALVKARAANDVRPTPAHVVRMIRDAPASLTNVALAAMHGCNHSTVSRIRNRSRRVESEARG